VKDPALFIAVVVFAVFLVWQLVRSGVRKRRIGKDSVSPPLPDHADRELVRILEDARSGSLKPRDGLHMVQSRLGRVDDARARAAHHLTSASIIYDIMHRPRAAARFYLKTLDEDPASSEALDGLRNLLSAGFMPPRRVEQAIWKALGRLDESETGSDQWQRLWAALASIYSDNARTTSRSDAIRSMLHSLAGDDEDASSM